MYRIYFDWNVLTQLKSSNRTDVIESIGALLKENQNNFLIPYSNAHIQDLLKGSEKEENLIFVKKDLDFIDEITKMQHLEFNALNNEVRPSIGSSHLLFDGFSESFKTDYLHPDNLENLFDDTDLPNFGKTITALWRTMPTGVDFKEFAKHEEVGELYSKYFKRVQEDNNLYNLMIDFSEFFRDLNKNPEIYKLLTTSFRKQFDFDPKVISNFSNPIEKLNALLKNSKINMNFDELSTIKVEQDNKVVNNALTKYAMEYVNLDMAGYHSDSFNKKNLYSNFTNDCHHSYYAGFCDSFVSHEKKLLKKSKILYDRYKIETETLTPSEFVSKYTERLNHDYHKEDLFETLADILKNDFIQEIKEHDFIDSKVYLFRPEVPLLNYFNFCYYILDKNQRHTIILRKVQKSFSNFSFFLELENLIEKCLKLFGEDYEKKGKIQDADKEELSKEKSFGRMWLIPHYFIELGVDEREISFQLRLEQITDEYIETLKK